MFIQSDLSLNILDTALDEDFMTLLPLLLLLKLLLVLYFLYRSKLVVEIGDLVGIFF